MILKGNTAPAVDASRVEGALAHHPVLLHRIHITLVSWYLHFRHFSYLRFGLCDGSWHSV